MKQRLGLRRERWQGRRLQRANRGFTLIELLIAAALLAVLAVLAWRGLDAVLTARQRIVAASDELRAMTVAFAQLDEDVRRSWPVRGLGLAVPAIGFSVAGEQAQVALELLRETSSLSEPTRLQQVVWRVRDAVLERGFGVWRQPGALAAGMPADSPAAVNDGLTWQPILSGVNGLQMRAWLNDGQGWVAAEALPGMLSGPGAVPGNPSPTAVTGLQVRVVRADGTALERFFPVKD